jgi:outer membrane protein assembly factor BamB/DNA-directed RNA polymerase subunit RPC12/RpoP
MTESFKCPSCSAPLEFEGKPVQKCRFCGSSVIVPVGTIQDSGAFGGQGNVDFGDFSSLTGKALKIAEIQKLLRAGNKIGAIKVFRETFGTSLAEAKEKVEAMERGESVDISGMRVQSANLRPPAIDGAAVRKVGVAVGGSIFIVAITVGLIIIGVTIAIFLLVSNSTSGGANFSYGSYGNARVNEARGIPAESKLADEILKFGGEGNGAGKFTDNRHVAVDGDGRIYSGDYQGGKIQVFDSTGKYLTQWIADPKMNLYDLKAARNGNVYVLQNKGIFVYKGETGEIVNKSENYDFKKMALRLDGNLVVTTSKGFVILDGHLKPVQEFKDAAEKANTVFGFDDVAVDGNNKIYAVDRQKGDVCIFSADGKFLNRFKTNTSTSRPIAIDNRGRIFVTDVSHIFVFDAEGKKLNSFDTTQAFGMTFNDADELFVAARPFVIKYKINF